MTAHVTDQSFENDVLKSSEPVVVDFWAEWCGPCKAMSPAVEKLSEEFKGKLKVVKINTSDNSEVPSRYGIQSIPTFMVIKNGQVVHQFVGSMPYDRFKAQVAPLL